MLVEFERYKRNERVWINPVHVVMIEPVSDVVTRIYLASGSKWVLVNCRAETAATLLTTGASGNATPASSPAAPGQGEAGRDQTEQTEQIEK